MSNISIILVLTIGTFCGSFTATSQSPIGSIDENFKGGRLEYYSIFRSKIQYPKELKSEKITGTVYFAIEIDTLGMIVDFEIRRGVCSQMDKEVEQKIYLTNGNWNQLMVDEKKVNYKIFDQVYFELR